MKKIYPTSIVLFFLLGTLFCQANLPKYIGTLHKDSSIRGVLPIHSFSSQLGTLKIYSLAAGKVTGFQFDRKWVASSTFTQNHEKATLYLEVIYQKNPQTTINFPEARGLKVPVSEVARVNGKVWAFIMEILPGQSIRLPLKSENIRILSFPLGEKDLNSMKAETRLDEKDLNSMKSGTRLDSVLMLVAALASTPTQLKVSVPTKGLIGIRLEKTAISVLDQIFSASKDENRIVLQDIQVTSEPPEFIFEHHAIFSFSKKKGDLKTNYLVAPAICEGFLKRLTTDLPNGKLGAYFIEKQESIIRRDGELPVSSCSLNLQSNLFLPSAPESPVTHKATLTFQKVFDRNLQDEGTEKKLRVYFHSTDAKSESLAKNIQTYFRNMQAKLAFGLVPHTTDVYLFQDMPELYRQTGEFTSVTYGSFTMLSNLQAKNCPATAAHEVNHLVFSAMMEKAARVVFGNEKYKRAPNWLREGTANYFARKETGYSLSSNELLLATRGVFDPKSTEIGLGVIKLSDLSQIIDMKDVDESDEFENLLTYHGSTALLEYADARFGSEAVEKFYQIYKDDRNVKQSLSKAFSISYTDLRQQWNAALDKMKKSFDQFYIENKPEAESIQDLLTDQDSINCIDPKGMENDVQTAKETLDRLSSQITASAACQKYVERVTSEHGFEKKSPPLAVLRAEAVIDDAKVHGCLK